MDSIANRTPVNASDCGDPEPTVNALAMSTGTKAAATTTTTTPAMHVRCVRAADVQIRPVEWLWPDRFALGKLNLMFGDPACNKSTLSLAMAAQVTHGATWVDGGACCPAGDVVICQAEDGAADTVVPRLMAAGADLERVHLLECVTTTDGKKEWAFRLDLHVPLLDELLATLPDARLVIIDPISCFLGKADSNSSGDVRGLLAPLAALAERRNVCVIMISHMSKAAARGALQAVSGSHGFGAAVRAAWLVARTPDSLSEDSRIMVSAKNNLGRHRDGIAFDVVSRDVRNAVSQPAVVWSRDPVKIRADSVVAPPRKITKAGLVSEWLDTLDLDTRAMPSAELYSLAEEQKFAKSTVQREIAKAEIPRWKNGLTGGWMIGARPDDGSIDDDQSF